jgi:hypothetical protein
MRAWQRAIASALDKPAWEKLNGWSPGGVAAELGITRQAVHQAVKRGQMDAVIVRDDRTDEMVLFMIPDYSVQAYKQRREQRRAG